MSKITLDNLSDNLKAYLEGLGLSEEQVLNLINENGLNEEELKAMLKDTMSINELNTNSKTVIGAINELFQDVDNGKNLIATSIGNPLVDGNSSFKAMSEAILGLRRTSENETDAKEVLYNMMIEDGYNEANINMTVDELIELLDDSGIQVDEIKQIACGTNHTFILKNDGSIWSCGLNHVGQLGLGDTDNRTTFTQVTTNINNDVKEVSCGYYRTFILKNDGSIWSCGNNDRGQLGLGDATTRTTFTQVTTNINNDVKLIACGDYHTFIIKNDGSVWSCGYNQYGQLGLGDVGNKSTFTQVTTNINNDVKQISCGEYHTFILKNDGSVWSCGYNTWGQLGLNDTTYRNTFTKVTTNINNDVKQIACGYNYTFILKNDGSVWSCGYNEYGQLGLNNTTNRTTFTQVTTNINNVVKQISCGNAHTFILKNDGSVWSCGYNDQGQLGLNDTTNRTTFTQVTTNINNDVKQISCGYHTFILKNDGSVWGCGYNNYGQLGLGSTTQKNTFNIIPNMSNTISEYEIQRLKLYYYLLDNSVNVTESMDIGTMLDLLVDDYINKLILGYENNLRIILTDEGVSVNNEDNMDSLIAKVDEEFDRQVVPQGTAVAANVDSGKTFINSTGQLVTGTSNKISPAGNAVASNVLSGKTFINSTGKTVTGTMADRGGAQTVTPGTSNKTLNSGYYSGNITVKGDSNLKAENIVSGKSIFGVSGTAQSLTICEGTDFTLHIWEPTSSGPYTTSDDYASYSEHEEGYDLKTVNHTGTYTCTATVNPGTYTTGYFEFVVYDSSGKVIKRSSEFEAVNSGSTNLGGRTTKSAALSATAGQKIAVRYRTEGQYEIRLWSFKIQFSLG